LIGNFLHDKRDLMSTVQRLFVLTDKIIWLDMKTNYSVCTTLVTALRVAKVLVCL